MIKQFDNIVLSADLTYLFSCLKFPEVKSIREYEEEALKPFVWFVCLLFFVSEQNFLHRKFTDN